jgi:hypothetical protein
VFWTQKTRPRARAEGLLVEQVNDEIVVFDTRTRKAHCLSPLAAVVFDHADGRTSLEGMAAVASERMDEDVSVESVERALEQLEDNDLLERDPGMTRRSMMGKSAAVGGAVFAAPLITSVIAPTAASAASATCGGPPPIPTVLCCPCSTASDANKDECCKVEGITNNCQCVKAEGDGTKYCKPSANAAEGDAVCLKKGTSGGLPAAGRMAPCEQCCVNQHATTGICGNLFPISQHNLIDAPNAVAPFANCNDTGSGYWSGSIPSISGCQCASCQPTTAPTP